VEEVDDGLALVHVAQQPEVVDRCGFFCFEAYNICDADLPANPLVFRGTFALSVSQPPVQLYFPHTVLRSK
jgi:hypothetical protein